MENKIKKKDYKYVCIRTTELIEVIEIAKDFDSKIQKYTNEKPIKIVYGNSFSELESVLNNEKTFYEKLVDNEVSIDEIDSYIKAWRNSNSRNSIYEHLGLSYEQYEIYKKQGIIYI